MAGQELSLRVTDFEAFPGVFEFRDGRWFWTGISSKAVQYLHDTQEQHNISSVLVFSSSSFSPRSALTSAKKMQGGMCVCILPALARQRHMERASISIGSYLPFQPFHQVSYP